MSPNFSKVFFLRNRSISLLIPMVFFMFFYSLGYYLLILDANMYLNDVINLFRLNFLYLFFPNMFSSTDTIFMPHIWSLSYEFYFYIIALSLTGIASLENIKFLALISIVLLFLTLFLHSINDKNFIVNLVFFITPWAIVRSQTFRSLECLQSYLLRAITSFVVILLFVLVCFGGKIQFVEYLCVTLALFLIILDTIQRPFIFNRTLGRLTLYIYLSHLGVNYLLWLMLPDISTLLLSLTSLGICILIAIIGIFVEGLFSKTPPIKVN